MSPAADPAIPAEPPGFRRLRLMVTVLTATLILGILTIAGTLVIRLSHEPAPPPVTALQVDEIELPPGETIIAIGATPSALSVATRDEDGEERIRVFHPETGAEVGAARVLRRAR